MNVEIDKSGVAHIYNQLNDKNEEFLQEINKLSNIVSNMGSSWQGADATNYMLLMNKVIKILNEYKDLIDKYNNYLNKVPGVYETLDQAYVRRNIS